MTEQGATHIMFDLGSKVRISPPIWPNHTLSLQPGDLSQFTPHGNGVYGYQGPGTNPFTSAPKEEECGGVIYFGTNITRADFDTLMHILGVQTRSVVNPSKGFAVFISESRQPGQDGYITQMRIVDKFGLKYMFGAITSEEYDGFPEQELSVPDTLWAFMESESKRWGTSWTQDKTKGLAGMFGGDGDFAREELAFGFMLENEYHQVYRIWSRARLVTK